MVHSVMLTVMTTNARSETGGLCNGIVPVMPVCVHAEWTITGGTTVSAANRQCQLLFDGDMPDEHPQISSETDDRGLLGGGSYPRWLISIHT